MDLKLNVYTDETLTKVKRTCEADKLKIPYRVAMHLVSLLDEINVEDELELIKLVTSNTDKVDKIVKATFGVSETELEYVDGAELIGMVVELYNWAMEKVNGLGGNEKNSVTPVTT